eukprot:g4663.t1
MGNNCNDCSTLSGYYCSDGITRKSIEACSEGKQRTGANYLQGGTCTDCPAGRFKSDAGVWDTTCAVCGEGKYASSTTKCDTCPIGSFCTGGVKAVCPAGQYTSEAGQSQCQTSPNQGQCLKCAEQASCGVDRYRTGCGGPSAGTCEACLATCGAGNFLENRCSGTGTSSSAECKSCSDRAKGINQVDGFTGCPNDQYLLSCGTGDANSVKGTCAKCQQSPQTVDAARACPAVTYLSKRCLKVDGPTSDVSACQACKACEDDFYTKGCSSDTMSAGECTACTKESDCDAATNYLDGKCLKADKPLANTATCKNCQDQCPAGQFIDGCSPTNGPGVCK